MKKPYAEFLKESARQRALISKLRAKGQTLESIGQSLGISRQRVKQILDKEGIRA